MKKILLPFCLLMFVGCQGGNPMVGGGDASVDPTVVDESAAVQQMAMEESESSASSAESIISSPSFVRGDSSRKLIRTAEVRFRTQSVEKATIGIEDIVVNNGGFVTISKIESSEDMVKSSNISDDESMEARLYTVSNDMIFSVPSSKIDTTLKSIAKYVEFLNYRRLFARDVTFDIMSYRLQAKRNNEYVGQVSGGSTKVADKILDRKESTDNAMLSSYMLNSQINYCTVNLSIYQSPKIAYNTVARLNGDRFAPNFSYELSQAFDTSWTIVKWIFLIFVRLLGLIVLGLVIFFGIRYYGRWLRGRKSALKKDL